MTWTVPREGCADSPEEIYYVIPHTAEFAGGCVDSSGDLYHVILHPAESTIDISCQQSLTSAIHRDSMIA